MKLNKLFLGAIAALASAAMVACSDDAPKGPDTPVEGGEQYMAVTIKSVGSNSRTTPADTEFEGPATGSPESDINTTNIRFYFFTADGSPFIMTGVVNGTVTHTNMVEPKEISVVNNTNGLPSTTINGILVLGTPDEGYKGNKPSKVIAIVNPKHDDKFVRYANKPLATIKDYKVELNDLDFKTFTMTNSSYYDEKGNEIYYTDVTGHIFDTQKEAEDQPAQIYLERLAAKIRVKGLTTYPAQNRNATGTLTTTSYKIVTGLDANGNEQSITTTLNVQLQGWNLVNRTGHSYAIKKISNFAPTGNNAPFADWNDATRHRSYWAETLANQPSDFYSTSYDINSASVTWLGNFDTNAPTTNITYTYGNTFFAKGEQGVKSATDRSTLATAIIVKATVCIPGADGADDTPVELVKWFNNYYTLSGFQAVVANAWNTEHAMQIQPNQVQLTYTSANKHKVQVSIDGNLQDYERFKDIYYWNKGLTSYYTNIKHHSADPDIANDVDLYGVVRNHIYDYTFSGVIGLGIPGNDPDEPEPTQDSYLAAVVNCLNWLVVNNPNVILGE